MEEEDEGRSLVQMEEDDVGRSLGADGGGECGGDAPLTRTAASTNSHRKFRGRPSRLQRTLSDESMCGAVASKQYRDVNDVICTTAIPAQATGSSREHFFSDPRLSPRARMDRSCLRMNGTTRPPASPILPLPDSAGIDWTNLVDAARAFEGTEAAMKPGSRSNIVESHNSTERRRGSNSHPSDALHGGHPPPPPVRAAASTSKSSGSAWRSSSGSTAQRVEELENRLSQVEQELERERSEKCLLQTQVQQLQQENIGLQEESRKAATQLRQFTEWFFNTIDRQ
ncbi:Signal-induced proliferation-associated 1-like protein 2 [Lamellibrachia satsuma]|nr:Signal-induced proliferation-associated 1-like protein 2 [Lamellibrachia satsuma]